MGRTITRQSVKLVLNDAGFKELMSGPEMQSLLSQYGSQKVSQLSDGEKEYKSNVMVNKSRAVAIVSADNFEARLSNSKNNDLLKAIL